MNYVKMKEFDPVPIVVKVPKETKNKLRVYCLERGISMNKLLIDAVKNQVEEIGIDFYPKNPGKEPNKPIL